MMFIVYYGDFVICNVLNDSSVVRLDSTICSGMSVTTDRITAQQTNPYGRNRANYGLKVILKAMYITNILVLILGGLVLGAEDRVRMVQVLSKMTSLSPATLT